MKRTFSTEEKEWIFDAWKQGVGFSEIAKILGSKPGTIFTALRNTGGIKPQPRKRSPRHLTLAEREEIRVGLSAKKSIREIARSLHRSPSTISREIKRNRGRRYYKAVDANNRAKRMAKRPKPYLLEQNPRLQQLVLQKLQSNWSPEQISGWLKKSQANEPSMQISAETIYKTLYYRIRSALHHTLVKHLRRSHSLRQSKRHSRKGERGTINIVNGTSISLRPPHVEKRNTIGHWEGDLVSGSKNTDQWQDQWGQDQWVRVIDCEENKGRAVSAAAFLLAIEAFAGWFFEYLIFEHRDGPFVPTPGQVGDLTAQLNRLRQLLRDHVLVQGLDLVGR